MKSATVVKDRVCCMDIETAAATGRSEYKGKTYYFCSPACKVKFDVQPEQYLCNSATTSKGGHCCCS